MPFYSYRTDIPNWATSFEFVNELQYLTNEVMDNIDLPVEEINFKLAQDPAFLVMSVTLPNGQRPPWLHTEVTLEGPDSEWSKPIDNERVYIDEQRTLFIINRSVERNDFGLIHAYGDNNYRLIIPPTTPQPLPLHVHLAAHFGVGGVGPGGVPVPVSPRRCNGCKTTAKALAAAIAAAATLPAIPAALIAAVAAYLGVYTVIAAAVIASLIGSAADAIAEDLCKRTGFC